MPIDLKVNKEGVAIRFSEALDQTTAEDASRYSVQRWQYRWTANYGSKHYRVSDPSKEGHDDVDVNSAKLSRDVKTVLLKLEDLRPVMQMRIDFDLKSADGERIKSTIHNTVNRVGG